MERTFNVGDVVKFKCSGFRRAGHFMVTATITKVNRKTIDVTENQGSRKPGTLWNVDKELILK